MILSTDLAQYITSKSDKPLRTKILLNGDIVISYDRANFTLRTTPRLDISKYIKEDITPEIYKEFHDFHGEGGEISVEYMVDNQQKSLRLHTVSTFANLGEIDYLIDRIGTPTQL
jgi:hypothetical protein